MSVRTSTFDIRNAAWEDSVFSLDIGAKVPEKQERVPASEQGIFSLNQMLRRHDDVWVRLEIDNYPPGWKGPGLEWIRAEIIGVEKGHLRVMLLEETAVPHGYKLGDELTACFEELSDSQAPINLVPVHKLKNRT